MMDGESFDYAEELTGIFRQAGCQTGPVLKTSLNDLTGYLSVFVTGDKLDRYVLQIAEALKAANIDFRYENIQDNSIGNSRTPNTIYIVVGRKNNL